MLDTHDRHYTEKMLLRHMILDARDKPSPEIREMLVQVYTKIFESQKDVFALNLARSGVRSVNANVIRNMTTEEMLKIVFKEN